jgi:YfiH family protein
MDIRFIEDREDGMCFRRSGDCLYLTFPLLDRQEDWLVNAFSTRFGGVSTGCFASMNFRREAGDDPENIRRNFELSGRAIGFNPGGIVCTHQTHTTHVKRVYQEDAGRGYQRDTGWTDVDGLITDVPGLVLTTFYADCVPLYFVDPVHRAIGLSHSGWRGTANGMGKWTVRRMQQEFGTDPKDLYAAIGPSICRDCYEVSEEVARQFPNCYLTGKGNGKYLLDLHEANRGIMAEAGIPLDHIAMPDLCTSCNPDLLFSHRKTGGKRGTCAAFLSIRPA